MSRFRSKLDGIQKARGAWLCTSCRAVSLMKRKRCLCGGDMAYFPSQRELNRAAELLLAERAGSITGLKFHPRYDLIVNGRKVATYVADASYVEDSVPVVEDTKPVGFMTPEARLRINLFEACYAPLKVRIV
jgi:hypothetical protein